LRFGLVFPAILLLATLAGLVLALEARPTFDEARTREFHHLVGGLGFGPALDLENCEFSFDPRLCPGCSYDCGPIPGGRAFCPYHAGSIFDYHADGLFPGPDRERPPDAPLP
jgi:hypothetical protein